MPLGRVRARAEFTALRQRGVRSRHRAVRVTYVPGADDTRVAFAIGRPVGTAVVRNRIRRRLRALFLELQPPAGIYLVSATAAAAARSYDDLRGDLRAAFAEVTGVAGS